MFSTFPLCKVNTKQYVFTKEPFIRTALYFSDRGLQIVIHQQKRTGHDLSCYSSFK
jgi:hypothetical protein